jgi:hypothetical protein
MRGQAGFWDVDERYVRLSEPGDPQDRSPQSERQVCRSPSQHSAECRRAIWWNLVQNPRLTTSAVAVRETSCQGIR